MKTQQQGYILLVTFSMLALCTALVSMFMIKGLTHKRLATIVVEQEKMNQFAVSATALVQSFLSFPSEDTKDSVQASTVGSNTSQAPANTPDDFHKKLLERVLPFVNKAQKFSVKEIEKDFPVVINLTFFCESGKININGLFDFVHKKFYNEGIAGKDQKVFATWLFDKIAKITEGPSLLQPFIDHVKDRKLPFNDITELLAIKEFAACFSQAVFYEPSKLHATHAALDKKTQKLYLTDIFTVASEHDTIQPWLLSPSVCVLLDIPQKDTQQAGNGKKEEKKVDLSFFKQQAHWQADWDTTLKLVYDITFDKIPAPIRSLFSTQFSANVFSALITVEQEAVESENSRIARVFAILKQKKLADNSITYDVIKIYQV